MYFGLRAGFEKVLKHRSSKFAMELGSHNDNNIRVYLDIDF